MVKKILLFLILFFLYCPFAIADNEIVKNIVSNVSKAIINCVIGEGNIDTGQGGIVTWQGEIVTWQGGGVIW